MIVTLTEDTGWRGRVYLAGTHDIPDELAIALGLAPPPEDPPLEPEEPPKRTTRKRT